jgi:FtsP/CotA-like multicopper oxidase with cupredoxin domain
MLLSACTTQLPVPTSFPAPNTIVANNGNLATDLYVQFALAKVTGATDDQGTPIDEIWTRAYSTTPADPQNPLDELPGPTFVFHPGDWLQITLHNQLNESTNQELKEAQDNIPPDSQDDIKDHIAHELNIPHNLNNTNLHVHGLHVDPKDDDATLLILPEDDNPGNYPPELQRLVPNKDRWWEWEYGYQLPADHLPGTHWYHAHQHGATAAHVENGMAGTLVIRPNVESDDLVPGLWHEDPDLTHDRVLMFQEIANYGIQQGAGEGPVVSRQASASDNYTTQWPDIAVNGEHQPTLALAPGQTERWRFIDAGANHRTASYLWVGALTPPETIPDSLSTQLEAITDYQSALPYITIGNTCPFTDTFDVQIDRFPGTASLVAVDGITLHEAVSISPDKPVLMGPGNRADLYVQAAEDAQGAYYVGKNYSVAPPQAILAKNPHYGHLFDAGDPAGFWRYQALATCGGGTNVVNVPGATFTETFTPTLAFPDLSHDPFALHTDFTGFRKPWPKKVNADGSMATQAAQATQTSQLTQTTALAPLLTGKPLGNGVSITPVSGDTYAFPGVGWVPAAGGPPSVVDGQVLMTVQITGPAATDSPLPPTNERLSQLSPTGDPAMTRLQRVNPDTGQLEQGIPNYVSPIPDSALSGSQVIVYDRSGINFNYQTTLTQTTSIQQFTINGRQFDLADFVGNPSANTLIQTAVPITVADDFDQAKVVGTYGYNGAGNFSNLVQIGDTSQAFLTNPGYYVPVVEKDGYFTYDYANPNNQPPSYQQITGLAAPHQPEATTAEEWLLINNSRIFHPFHIHINPFLVTEVGQVTHDGKQWSIRTLTPEEPLGYVLNNWMDVIIIPPQGYVKIRFWLNVPNQVPAAPGESGSDFVMKDNANIFAAWVQHCHILRHEDRGMMMVVSVKPKPESHSH